MLVTEHDKGKQIPAHTLSGTTVAGTTSRTRGRDITQPACMRESCMGDRSLTIAFRHDESQRARQLFAQWKQCLGQHRMARTSVHAVRAVVGGSVLRKISLTDVSSSLVLDFPSDQPSPSAVSYTHLTLPTKRIV